jgi:acetyl esterase
MPPVATHDPSQTKSILEPAAQQLADVTAGLPLLSELGYPAARKLLNDIQAGPVLKLPVDEEWVTVPAAVGDVRVRIIRPQASEGSLPVILYLHGGGWVLGNARTHDRLVRELAVGSGAALAFVEYSTSPEARYPVAIEQAYATAQFATGSPPVVVATATRLRSPRSSPPVNRFSTARANARGGGLFTIQRGGLRIQIIWKTVQGGNHFDHVHVGIRNVDAVSVEERR